VPNPPARSAAHVTATALAAHVRTVSLLRALTKCAPRASQVVGVAFQNVRDAENMGYIIPVPILEVRCPVDCQGVGAYSSHSPLVVRDRERRTLHYRYIAIAVRSP